MGQGVVLSCYRGPRFLEVLSPWVNISFSGLAHFQNPLSERETLQLKAVAMLPRKEEDCGWKLVEEFRKNMTHRDSSHPAMSINHLVSRQIKENSPETSRSYKPKSICNHIQACPSQSVKTSP